METNPVTVMDVLKDVQKILGEINVPVSQIDSIGIPIARALDGVRICVDAIENGAKEKIEKEESADEPADEGSDQDA